MDEKSNALSGDFLKPEDIISQLYISKGMKAADFGCASGYFSIPFAKVLGEEGVLYALDILPQMLETVDGKARSAGLTNVVTKRVNLEKKEGSTLDNDSVDWVILKDVLFQNKNKEIILEEVYRVVKRGGRALIIEWIKEKNFIGPESGLKVSREDLKKLIEGRGFVIEKEMPAGDFHSAFVAVK